MRKTKQQKCLELFPEISYDIRKWCNENLFLNYIFMSNKVNGKRTAVCDACGEAFETVDGKHKDECICPNCGRESMWWLERYKKSIFIKRELNIYYRTDEHNLRRWTKVYLSYSEGKRKIQYVDWYYSGISRYDGERFAYGEIHAMHKPNYIGRKYYDTPSEWKKWHVYPSLDIDQIFGREICKYLKPAERYNIEVLAKNMSKYPQTEYLFEAGMRNLSHDVSFLHHSEKGFDKLLGIEKKYIPLAKKYNICYVELLTIREWAKKEHMHEEDFLLCRKKSISGYELALAKEVFPAGASYGKIIRYADKQKGSFDNVRQIYVDYINMAKELKIDLKKKYDIWPKDLTAEHDRLAERISQIKKEKENKEFSRNVKKLYKTIPKTYENDKLCIVLPTAATDFVREGAELKICVGSNWYIRKHQNGESLICFIRKIGEEGKSYVCCEIGLSDCKVIQVHGYKNDAEKPLPKAVKEFAEKYAKEIKKFRENRKGV